MTLAHGQDHARRGGAIALVGGLVGALSASEAARGAEAPEPPTEPAPSGAEAPEPPTEPAPSAPPPPAPEPPVARGTSASAASRAAPDRRVRNRLYVGAMVGASPVEEEEGEVETLSDVEIVLGEALTARLVDRGDATLELIAAGRMNVRFADDATRVDDPRVRALGLRWRSPRVQVDVGRFTAEGGVWRLVDGVQVLAQVGRGVYVGAWGGASPDPWSTAPAARFGGGPLLGWRAEQGDVSVLGEVLATAEGFDRASGVVRGRLEVGRQVELSALVDLQTRGAEAPVVLSDATVRARFDPVEAWRLDLVYDAWSSWSYLLSTTRDPALTRFATRSRAALDDPWIPQDVYDPTVYHMVGATLRWRPALLRSGAGVHLELVGRYRHHDEALRRHARAGAKATVMGIAGGRLDLSLGGAFLWWSDEPAVEGSASLWAALDRPGRVALDSSATLVVQPHDGGAGTWGPWIYADLFVDALVGRGVTVALGYGFSNAQDLDRWDTWHSVMGRVGWTFDTSRARREEAP